MSNKKKIQEIITSKNEQFKIGTINDNISIITFELILYITINYENAQKEDVVIKITIILEGITEVGTVSKRIKLYFRKYINCQIYLNEPSLVNEIKLLLFYIY